mmetsp:Transcript_44456/g.67001  ORF Transcript_44456/g.67001 Transcript_44456/m.67001 type:complete len:279 (+) Transcript_44456:139-975(+)
MDKSKSLSISPSSSSSSLSSSPKTETTTPTATTHSANNLLRSASSSSSCRQSNPQERPQQDDSWNTSSSSLVSLGITSPMVRRNYRSSNSAGANDPENNNIDAAASSLSLQPIPDNDDKSKSTTLKMKAISTFHRFHTSAVAISNRPPFRYVFHNRPAKYAMKKFQQLPPKIQTAGIILFVIWKLVVATIILRAILSGGADARNTVFDHFGGALILGHHDQPPQLHTIDVERKMAVKQSRKKGDVVVLGDGILPAKQTSLDKNARNDTKVLDDVAESR